jgi:hypothetical protein
LVTDIPRPKNIQDAPRGPPLARCRHDLVGCCCSVQKLEKAFVRAPAIERSNGRIRLFFASSSISNFHSSSGRFLWRGLWRSFKSPDILGPPEAVLFTTPTHLPLDRSSLNSKEHNLLPYLCLSSEFCISFRVSPTLHSPLCRVKVPIGTRQAHRSTPRDPQHP